MDNTLYSNFQSSKYKPTVFTTLFSDNVLKSERIIKENVSEIMHEYSHQIQDITTIYGAASFLHFIEVFEQIADSIRTNTNGFKFGPINQDVNVREYYDSIQKLNDIYDVNPNWPRILKFTGKAILTNISFEYKNETRQQPILECEFIEQKGSISWHKIGVTEVMEAYSTQVQNRYQNSPVQYTGENYEYHAVSDILLKAFNGIKEEQIILICHWVLQHINPSYNLYVIITHLREKYGRSLPSLTDLNVEMKNMFNSNTQIKKTREDILAEIDRKSKSIPENIGYRELLSWYLTEIGNGIRQVGDSSNDFPLGSALLSNNNTDKQLLEIPIYVAINKTTGDCYTFGNDKSRNWYPLIFYCMKTVMNYVYANGKQEVKVQCPIYSGCNNSIISFKSCECLTNPWKMVVNAEKCPFGVACVLIGIKGVA